MNGRLLGGRVVWVGGRTGRAGHPGAPRRANGRGTAPARGSGAACADASGRWVPRASDLGLATSASRPRGCSACLPADDSPANVR